MIIYKQNNREFEQIGNCVKQNNRNTYNHQHDRFVVHKPGRGNSNSEMREGRSAEALIGEDIYGTWFAVNRISNLSRLGVFLYPLDSCCRISGIEILLFQFFFFLIFNSIFHYTNNIYILRFYFSSFLFSF